MTMDDGLELAQYTMIDFRHGTKVNPVVLKKQPKELPFSDREDEEREAISCISSF